MNDDDEWAEVEAAKQRVREAKTVRERLSALFDEHAARYRFVERHWFELQRQFGQRRAA